MATNRTPLITAETAAKLLNLTPRRVQQLAKEQIIPKAERGKYELVRIVPAYIKYLQDRSIGQDAAPTDYHSEKTRLTRAQAEKAEIESLALRGRLVPVDEVKASWSEMVAAARAKLLAMPQRIAQIAIAGTTIREIEESVRNEVYSALADLGGGAAGNSESVAAAAEDDDRGVGGGKTAPKSRSKRGARKVAKRKSAPSGGANGSAKPV